MYSLLNIIDEVNLMLTPTMATNSPPNLLQIPTHHSVKYPPTTYRGHVKDDYLSQIVGISNISTKIKDY